MTRRPGDSAESGHVGDTLFRITGGTGYCGTTYFSRISGNDAKRFITQKGPPYQTCPLTPCSPSGEDTVQGPELAVRGVQWKGLFEAAAPVRIFRLDTDPQEQHAEESGPLVETAIAARRRFEDECARTRDALAAATRGLPATAPATRDPAHQQRLRALGYL